MRGTKSMLKYLKAKIIAAVIFSAVMCVGVQAWAFDATQPISLKTASLGVCQVNAINTPPSAFATIYLDSSSRNAYGSVATSREHLVKDITQLSRADIAKYCKVLDATITVTGPSFGSYSEAEHIGFIIEGYSTGEAQTRTTPVFTRWEVAVKGKRATQLIITKTENIPIPIPTVTLSGAPVTVNSVDPFPVTATFSVGVTGFEDLAGDVTVINGSVTAISGGPEAYNVIITPDGSGDVEITVPAAAAKDRSGNNNTVSETQRITYDALVPTVTLSDAPVTVNSVVPFTVTATFSEDVTGFEDLAGDVTLTNASVTAITGGPAVYTLTITPTGEGDISLTIPAGAALDPAGNANTASATLVVGNSIVEDTQKAISGFMLGRVNNLASNQPGLTRFLMGGGCGSFDANATEGSASIDGCLSRGNTWAEVTGSWSGGSSYTLGSFGAHGFVNPNLIVGGLLQFDYADDDANNISGRGWMVGPYFAAKHGTQPLFLEGRLLYGQTENEITPLGSYTDSFETKRWLGQLRATGQYEYQNTTLMPLLDFIYTDDSQQAYTDTLGNTIASQTVGLMRFSAGMDFKTPLPVQAGTLDLTGGLSAIYTSTNGGAAQQDFEGGHGRAHLGLNYDMGTGATMHVGTFYDGLLSDYEAYGAKIGIELKF